MLTGNQCKERYWNNNVTKELVVPYFVKGLINTYGYTLSNKIKKYFRRSNVNFNIKIRLKYFSYDNWLHLPLRFNIK